MSVFGVSKSESRSRRGFEFRVTFLLVLGSALVGLDRFIVNPLFPVLARDLHLDYKDLGIISGALSLSWGISAIGTGRLSDRFGHKAVLVPTVLIFSLLVGSSGLATGLVSLVLVRIMMGFAEGAYIPASVSAVTAASAPTRVGFNNGLVSMATPLVGLGFGPAIALGLLQVLPSWHWVFGVVVVPGLLTTLLMWKFFPRDVRRSEGVNAIGNPTAAGLTIEDAAPLLTNGGIYVNALCMICWLVCQVVLSAFMPNYLTDYLHFSMAQMATCLSGLGVGSVCGMVVIPAVADRLGLKRVMGVAVAAAIPVLFILPALREVSSIVAALFFVMFVFGGATVITIGPLTSSIVSARSIGAACGIVGGAGEIVGGAIAPALAGLMARELGIPVIMKIVLFTCIFAFALIVLTMRTSLREPRLVVTAEGNRP